MSESSSANRIDNDHITGVINRFFNALEIINLSVSGRRSDPYGVFQYAESSLNVEILVKSVPEILPDTVEMPVFQVMVPER
ncbi:hypothetical protein D3C86_1381230 [compost metagenome]